MMIRRFPLVIALVWLLPPIAAAFQPTSRPAGPQAIIKVDESVSELGACWWGSTAKATFPIQNIGTLPLEIRNVRLPQGYEMDPKSPRKIGPGQHAELIVNAMVPSSGEEFETYVTVETNDTLTPSVMLTVRGIARPAIEVDPPMAGFGKISEGQGGEMVITLTNHLDEPVRIELEKIAEKTFAFDLTETKPGEEFQLKVSLKPPFDAGQRQSVVNLKTDLVSQPNIPIKAVAYLSPRIEIIPNEIRLGPPNMVGETNKVLVLHNNDEKPVRLVEAVSNDPAIALGVSEIAPGRAYKVTVTFPRGYDPGAEPKIITMQTDDFRQPTVEVAVVGPSVPTAPSSTTGIPTPIDKLVGRPAPTFELTTVEGKGVKNSAALANVLALNFFTSHNYDNTQIIKKVEELRKMYASRGVRFFNVAEQPPSPGPTFTPEQMIASMKKLGANAELALDLGNIVADNFHLTLYPTLVVVGKTGNIEIVQSGNPEDFVPSVKARLEALLGPAPLVRATPTSEPTPDEISKRPALGMMGMSIPTFSIMTVAGKPVGDAEVQDAPATVLDIAAANCPFCKRQFPLVESIRAEYEKKGVRFVNVCQTLHKRLTQDEAVAMMKTNGTNSELAYDPDNKISALFKVTSFPTLAVVRRDGRIEYVLVGAKKNTAALLREQLDKILKGDSALRGGK